MVGTYVEGPKGKMQPALCGGHDKGKVKKNVLRNLHPAMFQMLMGKILQSSVSLTQVLRKTQVVLSGQKTVAWWHPLVLCYMKPQISLHWMYRFFIIWAHMIALNLLFQCRYDS